MKTTVNDLYMYINSFAPFDVRWSRDNVGILVGSGESECRKVLLALDITAGTVEEAEKKSADTVISHHPVIFNPLRSLDRTSPVYHLARRGISALCAHTNLDYAAGGVNDVLISLCGVEGETEVLYDGDGLPCGRVGQLDRASDVRSYAGFLKKRLGAALIRFSDPVSDVSRLAAVGGAGAEYMLAAKRSGCDTLVTGEAKYNDFIDAAHIGVNLIEAGHFATENPVIPELARRLSAQFPDVEFIVSDHRDPVNIF